jgi:hypothetical protein
MKFDIYSPKFKKTFSAIVVIVIVLAMVITTVLPALV